ncbi:thiopeptide-type bacteriocin biosynthesis protein [Nocardiopsis metallicus]|uniref:Thiopeptide-type bacteriocin biosynthesis protein n=1 Tax=Nocardiopsis metallicus TaxID=179819 RepID=A0A840WBP0_9ACTN|nr:thiopeptide-type bacteriocin biosynthesis protein [Nocardiopsis metallicus]MBB5493564.1 thiopeptide-type bacteriocin biosynthesis protein [Nocardiopsis metallicus]
MTRTWSAVYVYLHRSRADIDSFLLEHLAPHAEELVANGHAEAWFYLRYWDGGPHLRARFLDADGDAVAGFADRMRALAEETSAAALDLDSGSYYAHLPRADPSRWHADGEVVDAVYEPETERYGGPRALEACEDFFAVSTRIALAVLRSAPRQHQRQAVAADLTTLAFGVLGFDDVEAVRQARGYYATWDYSAEVARGGTRARAEAERLFHSAPARWLQRRPQVERLVAGEGESTHHLWDRGLREVVGRLRRIDAEERQRGGQGLANGLERIVWSLLHMTHNRLGLDIDDERRIAWLLSLSYPRWEPPGDYFDPGVSAPDRQYAETSKYLPDTMAGAHLPRPVAPEPDREGAALAPVVTLPEPAPLTMSLGEALARRESGHGGYGSRLGLGELSALLGHGAGVSHRRADQPGRHAPPRTYPSPGAAYATQVWVVARHVRGLEPGTYRYRADGHRLLRADGPTEAERLTELSPFLRERADGRPGVVAQTVGATVFLVGDLGRLREGYGQRALRLLLQECGHVAQNLSLCAAALGLRSLVVSGFADDAANALLHLDGVDRTVLTLLPVGAGEGEMVDG